MMKTLLITFCLLVLLIGCKKDKVAPVACADTVSYSEDIQPLINMNCSTSGCHDANSAAGGYELTTYASISNHANIILSAINHESGVSPMPQGQVKLADSIIDKLSCWIANGKLEN